MFKKKYPVTSQIVRAFERSAARQHLLEMYIKNDNHNRAVKTSEEWQILYDKAWETVYKLYPELRSKKVNFNLPAREITILKEGK